MKDVIRHEGEVLDYFEVIEVPEPDTSLHIMGGPPTETPDWIIASWKRAAAERDKPSS